MNAYTEQLQGELNACGSMPVFEIEVVTKDGEKDFVCCEVFFRGNSIVAQRDGVSTRERKSKRIAETRLGVDNCYSLDEHLQMLHEEISEAILSGDLYELAN